MYFILNLQASLYIIINYYNIYICHFTQYYLIMFRNEEKMECLLFLNLVLFLDVLKNKNSVNFG